MPETDPQTRYYDEAGHEEWRCRYCEKRYRTSGSSSGPSNHLISFHKLELGSKRSAKALNIQISLDKAIAQAAAAPQKRRRPDTDTIEQDVLEALWVRCVVSNNLSFRLVESDEFRAFLKYLNKDAEELLAKDHSHVRWWIIRQYKALKNTLITTTLSRAKSKIHISCDLWTSPNSIAILGITAQFIDEHGTLKNLVLGMKELVGEHTGENMSKLILDVIKEYGIQKNLGYFTMDNAPDNDTLLTHLSSALRREFQVSYEAVHHRIRCQGHVINLAVKSFLFVTDKENIEQDNATNVYEVTLKEIEEWRKKGPLGKLHNFVVWIAGSTQRLHNFLELTNQRIPRDNTTRWNSWFMMLQMAWNLRELIDEFITLYGTTQLEDDRLSGEEWATISTIKDFLEKLSMSTKACESKQSTLDLVLPCCDYILSQFERHKTLFKDDAIFSPMFNLGWAKMNKYYELTYKTPAYVAALVLHPSRKWKYLEKHWKAGWVKTAKSTVKNLWLKKYKTPTAATATSTSTSTAPTTADPANKKNEFLEWLAEQEDTSFDDEYDRYCDMGQIPGIKIGYKWWLEDTQQRRFPLLSKMALDILSIPAMSADPERLFSGAKITISDRRNRLGIEVIQAIECLKSWLNIVEGLDDEIKDLDDIREEPPEGGGDGEVDLTVVS